MLKQFNHFLFSTKVWLTSVITTPFFFIFLNPMNKEFGNFNHTIEDLLLVILFGGMFSIPNWFLLIIASWQMNKNGKNIQQIKNTLTIISIGLTLILFFLLIFSIGFPVKWWTSLCYAFTISVGIQFYHLKSKTPEVAWSENILDEDIF